MALIQPEYGPQWGNIMRDALGTYASVNQIQRQNAEDDRKQKVLNLMSEIEKDPSKARMLKKLDPGAYNEIMQSRELENKAREKQFKDRASFAMSVKGLLPPQQVQAFEQRAKMLKDQGGDPSMALQMANVIRMGDPQGWAKTQIDSTIGQAQSAGLIEAPKKDKTGITWRPATDDEKAAYGITSKEPYQINSLGKLARAGGKGQTITFNAGEYTPGKIPAGQMLIEVNGKPELRDIPGGPSAIKTAEKKEQKAKAEANKQMYSDIVVDDVDRLISLYENEEFYDPVSGITGDVAAKISGTAASDADALRATIESAGTVDRLLEIKATGATFGSISEKELLLLKAARGNISRGQSKEQTLRNLKRYRKLYTNVMKKVMADPDASKYGFGSIPRAQLIGGKPSNRDMVTPEVAEQRYK